MGRLGALLCGENTTPLARYTLMAEAEQVHISTYPPLWPTRDPGSAGKDYDLGVFGEQSARTLGSLGEEAARVAEESTRGVSPVLDPFGDVISDVMREEGLLYCAFDPDDMCRTHGRAGVRPWEGSRTGGRGNGRRGRRRAVGRRSARS
ncbi:hypothetical protein [Streptomyces griseoruber]|uniref:hypothetical protein n=1 Tax=Streptomyces griseoruber TaxID=1943 RepID=UPI00197E08E6|nr:hypothetical protein [Streptomyces griseoruber]